MTYVAPQALVAEGDRVDPAPDGINLISEEEVLLFPPPLSPIHQIPGPCILLDLLPRHASHLMHAADDSLAAARS